MAPVLAERALSLLRRDILKRETCDSSYGQYRCYNNGWYNWGRWVLLGLIVVFFLLTLFCLSRTSRKRRTRGTQPMYGTGWLSQGPLAPPPYQAQQPAPPYSTYQEQNNGVAQPKPAYTGGQQPGYEMNNHGNNNENYNSYAPPAGPPPNEQYR